MTRTVAREIAIHFAFELGFSEKSAEDCLNQRLRPEVFASLAEEDSLYEEFPNPSQERYIRRLVCGVGEHSAELDAYIERYAVGWRFSRISKVAAAIMRVAMFELLYMPEIPPAAAINEAVELSKSYEPPEVTSFINGILGTFWRTEGKAFEAVSGNRETADTADGNSSRNEASAMEDEKRPHLQEKDRLASQEDGKREAADAAAGDKVLEAEEMKKVAQRERSAEQVRPWEWEPEQR